MKKTIYITLSAFLGIIISFVFHAIIEMVYLSYLKKNDIEIIWNQVSGKGDCALPVWFFYLLPIMGVIGGIVLGFRWWNLVYIRLKRDKTTF